MTDFYPLQESSIVVACETGAMLIAAENLHGFGVQDELRAAGISLLTEDRGHASLRTLLLEGRQIITF